MTVTGSNCGAVDASAVLLNSLRQVKTRLVFTSYCRATTDPDAPGADAAATISRFSASSHTFRLARSLVSTIGLVDTYHPAHTERPEPIQNSKIQAGDP